MSRSSTIIVCFALGFGALALSAVGCSQGIGDRCEVNADCESGLCVGGSNSAGKGGTCEDPFRPRDSGAGPGPDATSTDVASSDAANAEAGAETGGADGAGADGADDAGSAADGGVDASTGVDGASALDAPSAS